MACTEVRLVANGRRHAAQQRRNLRTRLGEAEDVVDEEQGVRAFLVAEVLGHRERGQRHTQARPGWLGHLSINQRRLGFLGDAGLDHA